MATTKTIDIRTAIPGPRSAEILERKAARDREREDDRAARSSPQEGRGATLTDVDGNVFIDFTGGVGCLNVGHAHPRVVEAATEQLARFTHTDFTVVPYEPYVELAERLLALAPFRGPAKAAFFNAGTEAVENAVKFARLYTKRPAVIAFEGAFHGRTLLSMTLTSRPHPYKVGMGPLAPEVYRAPFPQDYRGPDAETALAELRAAVPDPGRRRAGRGDHRRARAGRGRLPAGAAAIHGGPARDLRRARDLPRSPTRCRPASRRTGKLFAIEHYGVEPDLITVAKSIAGGLPLSGVLGKAEILDAAHDGAVGGTYVGNPVAQAAALAVLDVIEEEGLCERAVAIGETMRARMLAWQERFPAIGDVRGLGAMLAIELVEDRATKQPAPELAQAVIDAAMQRGLLLLKAGVHGNAIRVLCPLVITDAELDEALAVWEDALAHVLGVVRFSDARER